MSEAAVAEAPKPKFRREIQPKDDQGNPIGQPHVYEAETEQELLDKMAEGIANGTKRIRELARKAALERPTFSRPQEAEEIEDIAEPAPRELTADERFKLSNRFRDPEQVQEAFDELYEARTGRKPADAAKLQTKAAKDAAQVRAHAEANAFAAEHPEFVLCTANSEAMMGYISTRRMALTKKNFEIAFKELSDSGLLELRSVESPAAQPPVVEEGRTDPPETPAVKPQTQTVIPATLTRASGSGTGTAKKRGPSAAEIAKMNSKQLKEYYESTGQWNK